MNMEKLLEQLVWIAFYKSMLPISLRGWVNKLGLHVQERKAGTMTRMQAGGIFRKYLDAWQADGGDWDVKKFDRDTWDRRFSHIVEPTLEIADYLLTCTGGGEEIDEMSLQTLQLVFAEFNSTGTWPGLPTQEVIKKSFRKELVQQLNEFENRVATEPETMRNWTTLGLLYVRDHRPKEAENAFREAISVGTRTAINPTDSYRYLGRLYLEALSHGIAKVDIPIISYSGYDLPDLTPDDLGYTVEELSTMACEFLTRASDAMNEDDFGYAEENMALKVACEPSKEAVLEFKNWVEQSRPGGPRRKPSE